MTEKDDQGKGMESNPNKQPGEKPMAPKGTTYSKKIMEKAKEELKALPEKKPEDKDELSGRELIEVLSPELRKAMGKGYNLNELQALLEKLGVKLSKATIQSYLKTPAAKPAGKDKGKKAEGDHSEPKEGKKKPHVQIDDENL